MTTALVTGANRGLGLEHVRQFAARGVDVIATCRSGRAAGGLADLAKTAGVRLRVLPYEALDLAAADRIAEALDGAPVDYLIHNAGIIGAQSFAVGMEAQAFGAMDYDIWRDVLGVNLLAPFRLTETLIDNVAASERWYRRVLRIPVENEAEVIRVTPQDGLLRLDLGGPGADVDPAESVRGQQAVLDALTAEQSGACLNWRGETVPW